MSNKYEWVQIFLDDWDDLLNKNQKNLIIEALKSRDDHSIVSVLTRANRQVVDLVKEFDNDCAILIKMVKDET